MNPWILGGLAGLAGMALAGRGTTKKRAGEQHPGTAKKWTGGGSGTTKKRAANKAAKAKKDAAAAKAIKLSGGKGKLVREVNVSWSNSGEPEIPGWTLVGFKKNYYGPDWLIYRPKGVAGNQWNHVLMVA